LAAWIWLICAAIFFGRLAGVRREQRQTGARASSRVQALLIGGLMPTIAVFSLYSSRDHAR
jgi:hypothetical protein